MKKPNAHRAKQAAALIWILAVAIGVASGAEHYVTPNGQAGGDGSEARPWDLATALKHPPSVKPMDTIWLRGGLYRGPFISTLRGKEHAPVIVRAYPGERAILDGRDASAESVLTINGEWTWYWGLEIMNSDPNRGKAETRSTNPANRGTGLDIFGPGIKIINCVVHDAGSGMGWWKPSVDSEVYGTILFNNGWQGQSRASGPGIYTQNATGQKLLRDIILFNSYWSGLQLYGSANSQLNNYRLEGNVNFNGRWLVGGGAPAHNIEMVSNLLYGNTAEFFYSNRENQNLTLTGNYLPVVTSAVGWDRVEARNNTFFVPGRSNIPVQISISAGGTIQSSSFTGNTYITGSATQPIAGILDSSHPSTKNYSFADWQGTLGFDRDGKLLVYPKGIPPEAQVFVRRNQYEPNRGHVVIYNWPKADSVEVDIAAMNPRPGDRWVLRNVQNYFEEKLEGTYEGKPLKVRMTGWTVANPIGEEKPLYPSTFPEFGVFVLTLERAKNAPTVNGAQPQSSAVAPGAIVVTQIDGLRDNWLAAPGPEYGPELGGVMVGLRDSEGRDWMAAVLAVGPGGVTYAVPRQFAVGPVTATIFRGEERLDGGMFVLQETAPSLFSSDGSGTGAAAGYVTYGGTTIQPLADCSTWPCAAVPVDVQRAGSDPVVTLFGTGVRLRTADSTVSATVAEGKADVLGIEPDSGYPGLDLIRLRLPAGLAGRGTVPVQVAVDQISSNAVTVTLQ